jgi:hypothetical protein
MDLAEELRESLHGVLASGTIEIAKPADAPVRSRRFPGKYVVPRTSRGFTCGRKIARSHVASSPLPADPRSASCWPSNASVALLPGGWRSSVLIFSAIPNRSPAKTFASYSVGCSPKTFPTKPSKSYPSRPILEHSLSGLYARGLFRNGATRGAFLAVPQEATRDAIECSLTFALLWLERARQSSGKGLVSLLRLILPQGKASLLTHQLAALDSRVAIQVYELNSGSSTCSRSPETIVSPFWN